MKRYVWIFTILLFLSACGSESTVSTGSDTLFEQMDAQATGIDFSNDLAFDADFNIYKYRNFYNGGGVAIGDVNNDGLADIFFTANLTSNRLYLNRGNWQFEDVSAAAGVEGKAAWSTGVAMADVNGDGLLDIYVCNSGDIAGDNKQNELYINQGDDTFTEEAEIYGLADRGYSTHAVFFDYDRDGDLDCYLLNNSYQAIGSFNLRKSERDKRDLVGGDKLFRNDGNRFTDVSEEAGIYGSVIGFGLGVTVGDLDRDGWPDIYVSNDFFERDYIYMNNGDGTFREELEEQMRSTSAASMGADLGDINNDGYLDLFVTEMLPEGDDRLKTKTTFDNWDRYQFYQNNGYFHQFTRNMLQLNNRNQTFSDIGRLAGVHATDWSWGALMLDMNNDGRRDIFVANGIYQDLTDQDYIQFISNEETIRMITSGEEVDFKVLVDAIPSERISNYAFENTGKFSFDNRAAEWGLAEPSHSNGSAYGDLDNDGDLDLVVNNVNMPCFIYQNHSRERTPDQHYLQVKLEGTGANPFGVGASVLLRSGDQRWYQEQFPTRGFQSSMDYVMHFGVGQVEVLDELLVAWPDGSMSRIANPELDQVVTVRQAEAGAGELPVPSTRDPLFASQNTGPEAYRHIENTFSDFDRDRLLYHMTSTQGPAFCVGDVNGDGLDDFFAGGAKGQPGEMRVQQPDGSFRSVSETSFTADAGSEDVDAVFFDADGDGDLDLYVASGGSEFSSSSRALLDRVYLNDGQGIFTRSQQRLPAGRPESTGCVAAADYDGDGDQDLFVGIRQKPFYYGVPCNGYILENDGTGQFSDATPRVAPQLAGAGMFTDALWLDIDGDGDSDLVTASDWGPVQVYINENSQLTVATDNGLAAQTGWWTSLEAADFDGDGDIDLMAGNHGLNSRFKASAEEPVRMYINDFDRNGSAEQIITRYDEGRSLPMVLRHNLVEQMPHLKKKYLKYENYRGETVQDIFTEAELEGAIVLEVTQLASCLIRNDGNGQFRMEPLPMEAQFAPIFAFQTGDYNQDGIVDLLSAGNFHAAKPEVGRYDADYGLVLIGEPDGSFRVLRSADSGFQTQGAVRGMARLRTTKGELIAVISNNGPLQLFKPLSPARPEG